MRLKKNLKDLEQGTDKIVEMIRSQVLNSIKECILKKF